MEPVRPDPDHVAPDTELAGYRVCGLLGIGGFARVYHARHPVLGTEVAIKVLGGALAHDAEVAERFLREARAAARIAHPNVVRALDFGWLPDGRPYQVMELVRGPSLEAHLAEVGRLSIDTALAYLERLAAALDAAHAQGIVHRDLKPSNVLLEPRGERFEPRLTDFGIAKALAAGDDVRVTRTGTTLGTPVYMAPEQAMGRDIGPACDVYAFGVLAFELLTGDVPFDGNSALAIVMQHVQAPIPLASERRPELGAAFDGPLRWLMAKRPAERPPDLATAMAVLRDAASTPVRPVQAAAALAGAGSAAPVSAAPVIDAPVSAAPMLAGPGGEAPVIAAPVVAGPGPRARSEDSWIDIPGRGAAGRGRWRTLALGAAAAGAAVVAMMAAAPERAGSRVAPAAVTAPAPAAQVRAPAAPAPAAAHGDGAVAAAERAGTQAPGAAVSDAGARATAPSASAVESAPSAALASSDRDRDSGPSGPSDPSDPSDPDDDSDAASRAAPRAQPAPVPRARRAAPAAGAPGRATAASGAAAAPAPAPAVTDAPAPAPAIAPSDDLEIPAAYHD